jgi:hypothetical protein
MKPEKRFEFGLAPSAFDIQCSEFEIQRPGITNIEYRTPNDEVRENGLTPSAFSHALASARRLW